VFVHHIFIYDTREASCPVDHVLKQSGLTGKHRLLYLLLHCCVLRWHLIILCGAVFAVCWLRIKSFPLSADINCSRSCHVLPMHWLDASNWRACSPIITVLPVACLAVVEVQLVMIVVIVNMVVTSDKCQPVNCYGWYYLPVLIISCGSLICACENASVGVQATATAAAIPLCKQATAVGQQSQCRAI